MNRAYTRNEMLINVQDVSLALGEGKDRRLILREVNAEVRNLVRPGLEQGQTVGFLGPSGIGKTQLFKIIAGFQKPDTGSVLVGVDQVPTASGLIGVVSQYYRVLNHRTVLDNLTFAGKQGGLTKGDARDKAQSYLEKFDLSGQEPKLLPLN